MSNSKEIGGYFELELNNGFEYHGDAIALNTGRNAFEYILKVNNYNHIYLPYFTCDAMIEPLKKLNIDYEFYNINNHLLPDFNYEKVKNNQAFVYNNYFGLVGNDIAAIRSKCKNIIVDNSQAFFARALLDVDTFYSPRKFFGVSDGGYLYSKRKISEFLKPDISYNNMKHLLGRVDMGAQKFYKLYQKNEARLKNQSIKRMSVLTQNLLKNIAYDDVIRIRRYNYKFLEKYLNKINLLQLNLDKNAVPLVYPLLLKDGHSLKRKLIQNKIFIPTYWPNVLTWTKENSFEKFLAENLVCLPIDQRYNEADMQVIIDLINNE
ncbi:hypothetical protein J0871_10260 [Salegentibacter sp. BDJ18]|uniref:hypothetical protein n=1 Tax=Salegentibacter sp. BDJ18 TaxID=2816376 RepID=UPI001AB01889|nr:hypothetical protein [Salegentibacter sp. BDJ18]MBO2544797.1 hypothetical protein [Salegentibacter sp. BDJ18]